MSVYLNLISTAVPGYEYPQEKLRDKMKEIVAENETQERILHQIYSRSGISKRYSVLRDFNSGPRDSPMLFFNGHGAAPPTGFRNDIYIRESRKLYIETAKKLLEESGLKPSDITHLITVSCTGFYAPGPDYDIIRQTGLSPHTERYHLGFMGCYAAIPALKLAAKLTEADPGATAMVVSVELCSLHFQANPKTDDLISASVFGDGAAGAIVSARNFGKNPLKISGFSSTVTKKGSEDMAWSIGDQGFNMVLSTYIPDLLVSGLDDYIKPLLKKYGLSAADVGRWAVHPGGRAILDKVEHFMGMKNGTLTESRRVLDQYGNMSSATVLFVLREMMNDNKTRNRNIIALAFGPGLTIESAHLRVT